jgi:hypothetical protein
MGNTSSTGSDRELEGINGVQGYPDERHGVGHGPVPAAALRDPRSLEEAIQYVILCGPAEGLLRETCCARVEAHGYDADRATGAHRHLDKRGEIYSYPPGGEEPLRWRNACPREVLLRFLE